MPRLRKSYTIGKCLQSVFTFFRSVSRTWSSLRLRIAESTHSAMSFISGSFIPRVVAAGTPIRTPDGSIGPRGSSGSTFLFTEIPIRSSVSCTSRPDTP